MNKLSHNHPFMKQLRNLSNSIEAQHSNRRKIRESLRGLMKTFESRFEGECRQDWLLCQTAKDQQLEMESEIEDEGKGLKDWKWYLEQVRGYDSKIRCNYDLPARPLVENWLAQRGRADTRTKINLGKCRFWPYDGLVDDPEICLGVYLRYLTETIIEKGLSTYDDRRARQLRNELLDVLFEGTGFAEIQKKYFEMSEDMTLSPPKPFSEQKFRKNLRRSAYSIDENRGYDLVRLLLKKVLNHPSQTKVQVLCYLWISINAAIKGIPFQPHEILSLSPGELQKFGPSKTRRVAKHRIEIDNLRHVSISATLFGLLKLMSSFTTSLERLFSISLSTINQHLHRLNKDLGYDLIRDPVTAETFCIRLDLISGSRCPPTWERTANRINRRVQCVLLGSPSTARSKSVRFTDLSGISIATVKKLAPLPYIPSVIGSLVSLKRKRVFQI